MKKEITSNDVLKLIHLNLGFWIEAALENGFEVEPLENNCARELITMADMMAEIEEKMKGNTNV